MNPILKFNDWQLLAEKSNFDLTDDLEASIGEWILDRSNWINGNFHIWMGFSKGQNAYCIEVICIMYKEDDYI